MSKILNGAQLGDIWKESLTLLAAGGGCIGHMRGDFEGVTISSTAAAVVGWTVDPNLAGRGVPP
eukprot:gene28590-5885_t